MIGRIHKAFGGRYVVCPTENVGERYTLNARGTLKSNQLLVGDIVEFDPKDLVIKRLFDRKNRLFRPNISNIDAVVIVVSPKPEPDYYLIDKVIINAKRIDAEIIVAVNKTDIDDELYGKISSEYKDAGVSVIKFSAKLNQGVELLKERLKGKLTVLAGQSATGKTSIVNALFSLNLKTGEVAEKISRGKHTTTVSEIFVRDDVMLVDSPGFASIDALVKKEELKECYEEYVQVSSACRFRGCSHLNEPDCEVKNLVSKGVLSLSRYNRYIEIYNEINKGRKNYEEN